MCCAAVMFNPFKSRSKARTPKPGQPSKAYEAATPVSGDGVGRRSPDAADAHTIEGLFSLAQRLLSQAKGGHEVRSPPKMTRGNHPTHSPAAHACSKRTPLSARGPYPLFPRERGSSTHRRRRRVVAGGGQSLQRQSVEQ